MLKEAKPKHVEELANMMDKYAVIGVLNMHKMPARALQQMRESMRGTTDRKSTRLNSSHSRASRMPSSA